MSIRFAILTISDRCAAGLRADTSGPILVSAVTDRNWAVVQTGVLPDEYEDIKTTLIQWCDSGNIDVILTTGGTGFSPRDITPEATLAVIDRNAPGLCETMRFESRKLTPHAMLSRSIAGIRKKTLIVNLPGSPKAASENFGVISIVLPHAIDLLQNNPESDDLHNLAVKE